MPEDRDSSLQEKQSEDAPQKEEASAKAAAMEEQIAELTDSLKRTQAEFENYKKRVEREWDQRTKLAGERVITDLLAVLDTLDKAVEDTGNCRDAEALSEGMRGIRKQFVQTLQRAGLRTIPTDGPFDPFLHDALMREEMDGEDGRILEVFQKGYRLGDKVIRAAKVKISARKPDEPQPDDDGQDQPERDDIDEHEKE